MVGRTPLVETTVRCCTRSNVKRDGFKAGTFVELSMPLKNKKPRIKPIPTVLQPLFEDEAQAPAQEEQVIPPTPIKVMQKIGVDLEIDPSMPSKDELMVAPSSSRNASSDD